MRKLSSRVKSLEGIARRHIQVQQQPHAGA